MWAWTPFHSALLTLVSRCSGDHEKALQSVRKESLFSFLHENLHCRSMPKSVLGSVCFGQWAFQPSVLVVSAALDSRSWVQVVLGCRTGDLWWFTWAEIRYMGMPTKKKPPKQKTPSHFPLPSPLSLPNCLRRSANESMTGKKWHPVHPVGLLRNVMENQGTLKGLWVWLHHINQ